MKEKTISDTIIGFSTYEKYTMFQLKKSRRYALKVENDPGRRLTIREFEKLCSANKYCAYTYDSSNQGNSLNMSSIQISATYNKIVFMNSPNVIGLCGNNSGTIHFRNVRYVQNESDPAYLWDKYTIVCHNPILELTESFTILADKCEA